MSDLKNKLTNSESMKNISNIRTPMTPDNKYKRIGLLIIGVTLIIAGIIVWIVSCSNTAAANKKYSRENELDAETQIEVTTEITTGQ